MLVQLSYIDITEHSIYIPPPTTTEIKQIIVSLKNSSPGWDEIPAFLLKTCSNYYVKPLTYIINKSIEEGIFPNELKLARVVPIFKRVIQVVLVIIDLSLYYRFSPKYLKDICTIM